MNLSVSIHVPNADLGEDGQNNRNFADVLYEWPHIHLLNGSFPRKMEKYYEAVRRVLECISHGFFSASFS